MLKIMVAVLTPVLTTCVPAPEVAVTPASSPIPVHWIVDELDDRPFDAKHGDRVDVQLRDPYSRCEWMGGTLNIVTLVCEDVDF